MAEQALSSLVVIAARQQPQRPVMCICAQRRARGTLRALSRTASDSSVVRVPAKPQQTGLIACEKSV